MHLRDPEAQAVDDEPAHHRGVGVEAVAGPAVVGVAAAAVEQVVLLVGEPAEAEGRPVEAALGRVVVDDVEDDLEPGAVERLDEIAELVGGAERIGPAAVRGVRREVGNRLVAPVVRPSRRGGQPIELEHRQQFDRADTKVDQVRDPLDEPGVGATPSLGHARVRMRGEAAHVRLVHDRVVERPIERAVALPVVGRQVDDHALHRTTDRIRSRQATGPGRSPAERRRRARTGRAGRAARRTARPRPGPTAREPGRRTPGRPRCPARTRASSRPSGSSLASSGRTAARRVVGRGVEQQQIHPRGPLAEHGEVHPVGRHGRADRRGAARRDSRRSGPATSRCERRHHLAQSPTLACIIPPSTVYVVAVPYDAPPRRGTRRGWRSPRARPPGRAGSRPRASPARRDRRG